MKKIARFYASGDLFLLIKLYCLTRCCLARKEPSGFWLWLKIHEDINKTSYLIDKAGAQASIFRGWVMMVGCSHTSGTHRCPIVYPTPAHNTRVSFVIRWKPQLTFSFPAEPPTASKKGKSAENETEKTMPCLTLKFGMVNKRNQVGIQILIHGWLLQHLDCV